MFRKLLSMLCFVAFSVQIAFAQTGSITGQVTDNNNETIPGANVLLVETGQGAATNAEGNFSISNVEAGTYTLRVTFVGFQTSEQEVTIESGETLKVDIALEPGSIGLEEVVVTGYGDVSRREYTGSVSQVGSESIENVPVANVEQALQGNVTGAVITSATGTPGSIQQIKIRGTSSINAGTSPLYVIDGVPVVSGVNTSSDTDLDEDVSTSYLGVMANISSSDIESVTILKDAASTAKYGARGSNGVVVIKTKSGRAGDVTYSVSAQRGFNNRAVDGPGTLSASEWDKLYYDSGINAFGSREALEQSFGPSGWDGETNTDWGDVVTNDNAVQQEYALSARGGNERTTFYASTNYFEQEGQAIGSGLNRISGKLNINHKLDNRISIDNFFTGSYVKQNGILEGAGYFGSPVLSEYFMLPIDRAYNEDGSPNLDLSTNIFNPIYIQNNDITRKRNYRLLNNTNINVKLMDNFSFSTNFAIDYILTEEKYYNNPYYGDGEDVQGSVNDIDNRNFNYVWRNTLNYIWDVNEDNTLDFNLISESQRNYLSILDAYGEGMAADGLPNLNTVAVPQSTAGSTEDWAMQSFSGLVNYSFNDKLYIDASLRYEGNSRFAESERWGIFWALGAGYILTEEQFLQGIDWLSFLKVRASYGKTGNASIGLNNYQTLVGFGAYNDLPNIQPDQLGNLGLTWEKAHSLDAGVEFGIFNNTIDGSVTFFRKDSYDLLYEVPLSYSTGHENQIQNSGELYNQGLEVELTASIINRRNFAWRLGGNFTSVKNEITKLPTDLNGEPIEIITGSRYTAVEGYEVNGWYMREWAGVDPENGDPLWYMDDGNGGRTTTSEYNQADRYYQDGGASPTKFGGLNTRFDIKNFYVSANMYYAFGHKVFDSWANYMRSDGAYSFAFGQYAEQADYWTPENTNAENPKPIIGGNKNSNDTSSRYLYDGDYLRLKTLNVGYNIPARYMQNIGLKSATIYFLGQNLWTHAFDDDLKYDPETKQSGFIDLHAAPIKSVTFGVKVNF